MWLFKCYKFELILILLTKEKANDLIPNTLGLRTISELTQLITLFGTFLIINLQ